MKLITDAGAQAIPPVCLDGIEEPPTRSLLLPVEQNESREIPKLKVRPAPAFGFARRHGMSARLAALVLIFEVTLWPASLRPGRCPRPRLLQNAPLTIPSDESGSVHFLSCTAGVSCIFTRVPCRPAWLGAVSDSTT